MRILLKHVGDKMYVWKNATYKNEKYYIIEDSREIQVNETNIASVEGQEGIGYVVCNNCGALIKNTPEEIEKHYTERENNRDCTKCEFLAFENNVRNKDREVVAAGNGTYHITEKFTSELYCQRNYYSKRKVTHPDIARICTFYDCRRNGVRTPSSIFVKYPGAFDTVITVDALNAKKLKYDEYTGQYFLYDMKSRGTIKACVNQAGIVECFRVSSRGNLMYFYYSEKYDKMFFADSYSSTYTEGCPTWFRADKFEEAHQRIKALYEGAEKK